MKRRERLMWRNSKRKEMNSTSMVRKSYEVGNHLTDGTGLQLKRHISRTASSTASSIKTTPSGSAMYRASKRNGILFSGRNRAAEAKNLENPQEEFALCGEKEITHKIIFQ